MRHPEGKTMVGALYKFIEKNVVYHHSCVAKYNPEARKCN